MAAPKNPQRGPNPKKAPKRNRSKPTDIAFDKTRAKIQATQIVNRLNNYVLGKKGVIMDHTQVSAAKLLLDKSLPSLQNTTISGDENNPIAITTVTRTIVDPKDK